MSPVQAAPPDVFRSILLRALLAFFGATALLTISALLWGLLRLLGDDSGAAAARGMCVFSGVAWLIGLAVLVVLLAWERLSAGDQVRAVRSLTPGGSNGGASAPVRDVESVER